MVVINHLSENRWVVSLGMNRARKARYSVAVGGRTGRKRGSLSVRQELEGVTETHPIMLGHEIDGGARLATSQAVPLPLPWTHDQGECFAIGVERTSANQLRLAVFV
jgi:hypothetical protein